MADLTNYITYAAPSSGAPRIGHLDLATSQITPLSHASGTPLTSLTPLITATTTAVPTPFCSPLPLSSVRILPPALPARDVLAVGKNYTAHAAEFANSGFDSSDKTAQPSHPVIFTKRATSIVGCNDAIWAGEGWTQSLDYEGEIGVIIGRAACGVPESDEAWAYVWGFTIINDVTARAQQRDHKQFFLGKSGASHCPMGPIAVPASSLPNGGRDLSLETRVNGEVRQSASLAELIFSIPRLIAEISQGQTLLPGDVIATGTPVGVGIGKSPPVYLQPGDVVEVAVDGLGVLRNEVVAGPMPKPLEMEVPTAPGLTMLSTGKSTYIEQHGKGADLVVFVHGLGGTAGVWHPLLASLPRGVRSVFYDLEGHGQAPTAAESVVSISSYAADLAAVVEHAGGSGKVSVVAHSMGCMVALEYAKTHDVHGLMLLGPPACPLPAAAGEGARKRAADVREQGMGAVAGAVANAATAAGASALAKGAVRAMLLANSAEGYAKGCTALAGATAMSVPEVKVGGRCVCVAGDEDKVASVPVVQALADRIGGSVEVLPGVGHWMVQEAPEEVGRVLQSVVGNS
ncbi:hypothetical protein EDC01DRAFT_656982 [Geopyxis carbonaria]|nr:hypothetical protein EDC01DRAFT_656982 [Geopyxis carbonaria]